MSDAQAISLPGRSPTICVVPGFASGPKSYKPLLDELHTLGNRVLLVPSLRRGGYRGLTQPRSLTLQAAYVAAQLTGDQNILLGHSMGGAVALIAGALYPKAIARVIALCPAGVCPDNPFSLTRRLVKKVLAERRAMLQQGVNGRIMYRTVVAEGRDYLLANPLRALYEGWALGTYSAANLAFRHKVDVWYCAGTRDPLFTCSHLAQGLAHVAPARQIVVNCGHDPQNKPRDAKSVVSALAERNLFYL